MSLASPLVWTHYPDSDDWVVYNSASADIHLLTASAHRLWELVTSTPQLSFEDLVAMLAADLGRPSDAALAAATRTTLDFMDQIGLVRLTSR